MSNDDMITARAEATQELASEICKTCGSIMTRHGNDPLGVAVLAGGIAHAITSMDKIDPRIRIIVRELLKD
jgi:butyrate kinase